MADFYSLHGQGHAMVSYITNNKEPLHKKTHLYKLHTDFTIKCFLMFNIQQYNLWSRHRDKA